MKTITLKVIEFANRDTEHLLGNIDLYARLYGNVAVEFDIERREFSSLEQEEYKAGYRRPTEDWLKKQGVGVFARDYDCVFVLFADDQWRGKRGNKLGGYAHGPVAGVPVVTMTATEGQTRDIEPDEDTSEFVARFLHELSHTVFDDLMGRPDLDSTHAWDYDHDDLSGALGEWDLRLYQTVAERKGILKQIISAAKLAVNLLRQLAERQETSLEEWGEAIRKHEGWFPGSLTYRNNNPGALRWSKYQSGTRDGFAYFDDYETGWQALMFQLRIAVDGRSDVYSPDMTLYDFFEVYAPPSDNNDSRHYAEVVARALGVDPTILIKELA